MYVHYIIPWVFFTVRQENRNVQDTVSSSSKRITLRGHVEVKKKVELREEKREFTGIK